MATRRGGECSVCLIGAGDWGWPYAFLNATRIAVRNDSPSGPREARSVIVIYILGAVWVLAP